MAEVKGFKECRERFNKIVIEHIRNELKLVCDALVVDALKSESFQSFTGNTVTSYSCGLYEEGRLVYVIESGDKLSFPVRRKIPKGKTIYLSKPYEGRPRSVTGRVNTDGMYGQESSMKFLNQYKAPKKGFAIVMTTGTEYSEYLENAYKVNVLTETFNRAKKIMLNNIKPIP